MIIANSYRHNVAKYPDLEEVYCDKTHSWWQVDL